jgi:hypothetical protein
MNIFGLLLYGSSNVVHNVEPVFLSYLISNFLIHKQGSLIIGNYICICTSLCTYRSSRCLVCKLEN